MRHVSTVRLLGCPVGTVLPMAVQPGLQEWRGMRRGKGADAVRAAIPRAGAGRP